MSQTEDKYMTLFSFRSSMRSPPSLLNRLLRHTPPRMTASTIMAPSPIKLVEPFINFVAPFVVVVDDEEAVEVDVKFEVDDDDDDDDEIEEEVVVVIGTEKNDSVGCPDA